MEDRDWVEEMVPEELAVGRQGLDYTRSWAQAIIAPAIIDFKE